MRTTIRLDPEVAAAAADLRRKRGIGLGEAVNALARAGLSRDSGRTRFSQRTANVGLQMDVTDVAEILERLDELDSGERR